MFLEPILKDNVYLLQPVHRWRSCWPLWPAVARKWSAQWGCRLFLPRLGSSPARMMVNQCQHGGVNDRAGYWCQVGENTSMQTACRWHPWLTHPWLGDGNDVAG